MFAFFDFLFWQKFSFAVIFFLYFCVKIKHFYWSLAYGTIGSQAEGTLFMRGWNVGMVESALQGSP